MAEGDNYSYESGNGYGDPTQLPLAITPDGGVVVLNYTPTGIDPETTDPTEPITIVIPPTPTQDIIFEPVIETIAPPTAMFDSVSSTGYNVQFVNESLGNIDSLVWDFGDGEASTELHPTHEYSAAGDFLVTLSVTNNGGVDTYRTYVSSIAPSPEAAFDFAIGGYVVYLTNKSNTLSWHWDFGDGQTSTEKNPKHTYAATGDYTITLTTDGLTVTKTVVIDVEILLEWKDNADNEDGFKIEHSLTGEEGTWSEIALIEESDIVSYGVTKEKNGVDSAVVNFFRVLAYSAAGDSDSSNESNVRCG